MKTRRLRGVAPLAATVLWLCGMELTAADTPPWERHYEAARTALASGDTDRAKRELKLSLQDNPLDGRSHFLLASILAREGDLDQAIVGFQQTAILEPNNAMIRQNFEMFKEIHDRTDQRKIS